MLKKHLLTTTLLFSLIVCKAQPATIETANTPPTSYTQHYEEVINRTAWWQHDRFGMFIHFGAYAVPARGEWIKSNERMTNESYQKYIDAFNPVDFDAREWARLASSRLS